MAFSDRRVSNKFIYDDDAHISSPDFGRDSSNTNLLGNEDKMDPRTKCSIVIVSIVAACIVGGTIAGLVAGLQLYQSAVPTTLAPPTTAAQASYQYIGQACNVSSDCISSGYCDTITKVCSCSPEFYFDSGSGTCRTRKSYGESCATATECEFNMLLMCSSSICQCDAMLFWNPNTRRCEDKRGLGETCIGVSNECYSSKMKCITFEGSATQTRCICPLDTTFFSFFTGDCETKKVYGTTCYATFECIDYAWCTPFPGDSQARCNCIPSYYYDSASSSCKAKKTYLASCTYNYECIDNMLSLTCVSGKCNCSSNSNWNGTHCDFMKPYGGVCNKTSDCLNSGTVCQWVAEQSNFQCLCQTGMFFSLTNNSCIGFKQLGQICKDTTECDVNATCLFQSTTSDMRCQCTVTTFYASDSKTCLFLKSNNESCTASSQCLSKLGLVCSSNRCQCDVNYYWNGVDCQTKKSYNSYGSYSQSCISSNECKDQFGLTNCFNGNCRCSPPKTWNSGTGLCV